jgi:hypothetical protein
MNANNLESSQKVLPLTSWYLPFLQGWQYVDEICGRVKSPNRPRSQRWQCWADEVGVLEFPNWPNRHGIQTDAPDSSEYFDVGQIEQFAFPADILNRPTAHPSHFTANVTHLSFSYKM